MLVFFFFFLNTLNLFNLLLIIKKRNKGKTVNQQKEKKNKKSVWKQLTIKKTLKQLTTCEQYKKSGTEPINIIKNRLKTKIN